MASELRDAIEAASASLLARQREDGSWPGENLGSAQFTGMLLATQAWFGTLSGSDAEAGARWLRSQQLPDGSHPASPDSGIGDLDTTVLALAGLAASGVAADDRARVRARDWIDARGGFAEAHLPPRIFACVAGLVGPESLGAATLELRALPDVDRFLSRRFAVVAELVLNQLPAVVLGLQQGGPLQLDPATQPLQESALRYLLRFQDRHGSFAGMLNTTALGALSLAFLGVDRADPRLARAISCLDRWKTHGDQGLQGMAFTSEVWNTAYAVRALLAAGTPEGRRAAQTGVQYLLSQQSQRGIPWDVQDPGAGELPSGGWAYEDSNELVSDCDTTAAVLWTLQAAADAGITGELGGAIARGTGWLLGMQNASGGWPAFTHGLKEKPPGPLFSEPPAIAPEDPESAMEIVADPPFVMGDPSWEDLTGRVLEALGALGRDHSDPVVQRAVEFLHFQLDASAHWWGRWEVDYLPSSAYIVAGLHAVGVDRRTDWVGRVASWVESCQNADGGFGEDALSYRDPGNAGKGDSSPSHTAQVLACGFDFGISKEVAGRAVRYLLDTLGSDGNWRFERASATLLPPNQFYINPVYGHCRALECLARWETTTPGSVDG